MGKLMCLPEAQMEVIRGHVDAGEIIYWVGCEPRFHYWCRRYLRVTIFTLWIVVMGVMAAMMVLMNPAFLQKSLAYALPVLTPSCLAALGVSLLARELAHVRKGGPDLYAITTRRALVISREGAPHVWAYGSEILRTLHVKRRQDGSGDIFFERAIGWTTDAEGRSTHRVKQVGFFGLRSVEDVIRQLPRL